MRSLLLRLLLAAGLASQAPGAAVPVPVIQQIQPLGAVPGAETALQLTGENFAGAVTVWSTFSAAVSSITSGSSSNGPAASFKLTLPRDLPAGLGAIRLVTTNGLSNPQLFLLDPVPAGVSTGTNRGPLTAQPIPVPGAIDGACAEVRSDYYRFSSKKGDRLSVEVVAQRIGSPLDPFLRILDLDRKELDAADDTPGLGADARLDFRCPRTADYLVEVRDTRYGGGPRHRYRLRVGRPLPVRLPFPLARTLAHLGQNTVRPQQVQEIEANNAQAQLLTLPAEVNGRFDKPGDRDVYQFAVDKDEKLLITGRTRSLASPCDLFLQLQTTNEIKIAEANANAADEGILTNRFAEAGKYRLLVEELNNQGGPRMNYRILIQPLRAGFTLSSETERISMPAGASIEFDVQAQRRDYDGPITLSLVGLDRRFAVTNQVIEAKTNSTRVTITAPEDVELGQCFEFSILGRATIADVEAKARVSTLAAIRNLFPDLRHPPLELDGLITLSIASVKSSTVPPPAKKKK